MQGTAPDTCKNGRVSLLYSPSPGPFPPIQTGVCPDWMGVIGSPCGGAYLTVAKMLMILVNVDP